MLIFLLDLRFFVKWVVISPPPFSRPMAARLPEPGRFFNKAILTYVLDGADRIYSSRSPYLHGQPLAVFLLSKFGVACSRDSCTLPLSQFSGGQVSTRFHAFRFAAAPLSAAARSVWLRTRLWAILRLRPFASEQFDGTFTQTFLGVYHCYAAIEPNLCSIDAIILRAIV